jgi:ERF superfamily
MSDTPTPPATFHQKIVAIQSSLKAPKSQTNTFGKYKYRSCEDILEAVKPLLHEHDLTMSISDEIVMIGTRYYVKATATVNWTTEHRSATAFAREEDDKKGMDGAQITGAASSYARKYALNGLFCIDDTKDADSTNDHKPKPAEKSVPEKKEKTPPSVTNVMEYLTSTKTEAELTKVYDRAMTYRWEQGDAEKIGHCFKACLIRLNGWTLKDGTFYNASDVPMAALFTDAASHKLTLDRNLPVHYTHAL